MNFELVKRSYIEAMLWSSVCDDDSNESITDNHSIHDLSVEAMAIVDEDVKKFIELSQPILDKSDKDYYDGDIGHNFWLNRNGHGAGFWSGGFPDIGDELSELCKQFKEQMPYNYNGKIEIE
jgi:hypothetical protein